MSNFQRNVLILKVHQHHAHDFEGMSHLEGNVTFRRVCHISFRVCQTQNGRYVKIERSICQTQKGMSNLGRYFKLRRTVCHTQNGMSNLEWIVTIRKVHMSKLKRSVCQTQKDTYVKNLERYVKLTKVCHTKEGQFSNKRSSLFQQYSKMRLG